MRITNEISCRLFGPKFRNEIEKNEKVQHNCTNTDFLY